VPWSPALVELAHPREVRLGVAYSVSGAICSAIYLFPYKRASALASPHVLAYALLIVAALSSTALDLWQRRGARATGDRRVFWSTSALLSILTISGNFCGAQAVTRLDPALVSVLLRTEIVFVGVLAALLLGERLTPALVAGVVVALVGLGVMRWPLALDNAGAGALWALGGALSFGMMQVLTRRVIGRISPVTVNSCRLWIAVGLMSFIPGLPRAALGEDGVFWASVTVAALFGPFLGRLFIMFSLRSLRAARSALFLLSAPVFAFAIGFVAFGNVPRLRELVGGAIMLSGIALPSLARLAEERSRADA
jgi:drug/metabolite transporter (DMT)-like permease